jgi:hypothetical protein
MWCGLSIEASGRAMNSNLRQQRRDKFSQKSCLGIIMNFSSRFKHEEEIIDLFFPKKCLILINQKRLRLIS